MQSMDKFSFLSSLYFSNFHTAKTLYLSFPLRFEYSHSSHVSGTIIPSIALTISSSMSLTALLSLKQLLFITLYPKYNFIYKLHLNDSLALSEIQTFVLLIHYTSIQTKIQAYFTLSPPPPCTASYKMQCHRAIYPSCPRSAMLLRICDHGFEPALSHIYDQDLPANLPFSAL